ncbi:dihydrodipicolinate synthase family protein [Saccharopolyspora aridisoli]|uniref:Dihydrodipicolinate synthase family protein n=1 Tax=Saccharopolyspora aridisoli TaxID=2530385 RepID=A0A4V2Y8C6_9PSEU|nr:dihydrodipicolinate synthase family protein [Saccharopolyspora aridisoli]TDC95445.1 dihydrodipicolinate synthase family protein [Saccharopolyspora aridisoli]
MSSTPQLTGILAAVVTPLSPDASAVDADGVKRQAEHIISAGINGLVPGGSTGEFTTLSTDERKRVNELYVEAAAGRVPVVAGTGALSTAETVELSRHAEQAGAAAVMVVPPFYDAPNFDELLAHYGAVSEAIRMPVMYYNIPAATGVELTAEQLAQLGRETGVTSFKDTGGDFPRFTSVQQEHAADITALNGWDTLTFAALAGGAKAGVWGTASVIPQLCAEIYDALAVRGDLEAGRELWHKIFPICQFLESHNYACAIKTGLDLVGQSAGPLRRPVLPLAREHREEFRRLLQAAGVATVEDGALA